MKTTDLRQLIKESIQEYIREVDASAAVAAQEAKIRACEEAIALREKKINLEGLDETMHEMIDQSKLNELKKEVKALESYKKKTEKLLEKMKSKTEKKDKEEETEEGRAIINQEGTVDEVTIDETFPEAGSQLEETELNESFLHMQKLAGLITESEYKKKLKEFDIDQFLFGNTPKPPAASFMNKWNPVPPANEENFKKLTGKTPIRIWADSDDTVGNYLITTDGNKYYLHNSRDNYKKFETFNSEEDAKKQVK